MREVERMNRISLLLTGLACLGTLLLGCNGDDSYMYHSYCETNVCKDPTEVRQRPTTFALEILLDDSTDSRVAHLYTIDCDYLPDEDSTETSTFCVDSLKYGNSDSLIGLPQKSKYEYNYNYLGYDLGLAYLGPGEVAVHQFARIPIDDDDHLRFTLVDHQKKEKLMNLDLSDYIGIYKVHGDTFDFKFPDSTFFVAYSRDTISNTGADESLYTRSNEYGCYEYYRSDYTWVDTTLYCYVDPGDHYENIYSAITAKDFFAVYLEDTSACLSHRFYVQENQRSDFIAPTISCYKMDFGQAPDSLTLWNLYSVKEMDQVVKDSVGDRMQSNHVWGHRHTWHTVSRLGGQGPDGEDDFTIYMRYME